MQVTSPNRLSNTASTLLNTAERRTALAFFKRAAALDPTPPILCNLAIALTNFGEYGEACRVLQGLLDKNDADLAAWHAFGVLSLVAGEPEQAVRCFDSCISLDPANGTHKFDRACALMQAGRWKEGWAAYECRKDYKPERTFPGLPRWDGSPGKFVYVWAEQGIGDTFQFARYLPLVAKLSRRVILAVPPALWCLFEGYRECGVELLKLGTGVDGLDAEVSLMSLPHLLGPTPAEWPPDPGLLAKHVPPRLLFGHDNELNDRLKVGLCWACAPSSHNWRERTVDFGELLQLTAAANADFYSLQVGRAAADITAHQAQLVIDDLSGTLADDWAATAGALKTLDLVVTTDTSVAHLAAILGKPMVMLLARRDWWRWGNEGTTTPWYPTMTIVRQKVPFAWGEEVRQVSTILGNAARARSAKAAA